MEERNYHNVISSKDALESFLTRKKLDNHQRIAGVGIDIWFEYSDEEEVLYTEGDNPLPVDIRHISEIYIDGEKINLPYFIIEEKQMGRKKITIDATDIIDAIRPIVGEIDGAYDLSYNLNGCIDLVKDGDLKPGYLYLCDLSAFDDFFDDEEEDIDSIDNIMDIEEFTGVYHESYAGSDDINIVIKDNL